MYFTSMKKIFRLSSYRSGAFVRVTLSVHADSIKDSDINNLSAYQNTKYDSLYQPAKRTV